MPLGQPDRSFLKQIYRDLADEPLPPDSRFYGPVYEVLALDDPVQQISTLIDFDGVESIRLFSGFRGSRQDHRTAATETQAGNPGLLRSYADALKYVNAAEPIDITDLLMVLAGAFSDALEERLGVDNTRETYWDRLWAFLQREVTSRTPASNWSTRRR